MAIKLALLKSGEEVISEITEMITEKQIPNKYFIGYPPKQQSNITIEKSIALVEKFAGKINNIVKNTGSHNGRIDFEKVIISSFIFDKYLATYINITIEAKVEG